LLKGVVVAVLGLVVGVPAIAAQERTAALDEVIDRWRAKEPVHALIGGWLSTDIGPPLGPNYFQPYQTPEQRATARGLSRRSTADLPVAQPIKCGALTKSVFVVGEVHDNREHHIFRARSEFGPPWACAVVFEQFSTDQQPAIDAFMARPKEQRTLDGFLRAVEWDQSGWHKYDYKPLFQAVLDADMSIYAGDPPKALIRRAAKEGPAALPPDELKRLGLDQPLDPSLHDASLTELEESHCGAMPKSAFGGMAFAQRLRDATLADVALKALDKHGAVTVFAGNGHVRTDRGIAWYVRARGANVPVHATMLIEVEDGKTDPEAYVPKGPDLKPATDTIVFTPRAEREDPCTAFAKRASQPAGPPTKN
jgi:uncharacterized iron-regulated protein